MHQLQILKYILLQNIYLILCILLLYFKSHCHKSTNEENKNRQKQKKQINK